MKTKNHFILRATICALALFSLLSHPLTVSAQTQTPPASDIRGLRLSLAKLSVADQKNAFGGMSPELKCAVWKDRIAEALERPLKEKQRNVLLRIGARIRPEICQADNNAEKTQFSNFVKNLEKEANEAFANEDARLLVQILTQLTDKIPSAGAIQSTPAATSPACECVIGGGWDDKCGIGQTCQAAACTTNSCGFLWLRTCNGMCVWNPTTASVPATSTIRDGLQTVTFGTLQGQVIVNMTDDLAAGGTNLGTVSTQPKGKTEEERARNQSELDGHVVEIEGQSTPVSAGTFTFSIPRTRAPGTTNVSLKDKKGNVVGLAPVACGPPILPLPPTASDQVPTTIQEGRTFEVTGAFGISEVSPTTQSSSQGLARTTLSIGGREVQPVAASVRKYVYESPTYTTDTPRMGPSKAVFTRYGPNGEKVVVKESEIFDLGIKLTAPTLVLARGGKTTVTFTVTGAGGSRQPIPIQVVCTGQVDMQGGNSQTVYVPPSSDPNAIHTFTLDVTATKGTGPFSVTATVVVTKTKGTPDATGPEKRAEVFVDMTGY